MEFKEIVKTRRSVRKFIDKRVPAKVIDTIIEQALTAPSARNTRSTQFMVIDDRETIGRMSLMRDYGSAFIKNAPLVIVVMGSKEVDLWRENAAISATILQLACVDEGLASCWVHVDGRPREKAAPDAETAQDYLSKLLSIPDDCNVLCAIAIGYSSFEPAPLPESDDRARVIRFVK